MGKRGPSKQANSLRAESRAGKFLEPANGELSKDPVFFSVPTPAQACAEIVRAVSTLGIENTAHDISVSMFADLVADRAQARKTWLDHCSLYPPPKVDSEISRVQDRYLSAYTYLHSECLKMCLQFGLTPASVLDIPAGAQKGKGGVVNGAPKAELRRGQM
jgi:hypothetical protein